MSKELQLLLFDLLKKKGHKKSYFKMLKKEIIQLSLKYMLCPCSVLNQVKMDR